MLSPEYYDHCADDILEQYAALEDAIISSMIKKLMKHGYMTESAKHQAEVIQETGMIYGDVVQIIANYTDATANQVKALFEDAGVRTVEIDNEVYREVGKSPVDIRQSDSMKQILEAGCRKTFNEMWNLTKTLAVTTQREYIKACNNAYMQVSSGAFSYDEAIKNAVKNAAVGGLEVEYPSGSKSKLDVAIRRSVLTGVGQTCAEIGKMNAEANGCHLMEITAHSGARPGHVVWQGQLVTLTGEDAHKVIDGMYVFTLYEIGYGDVTGFKGANCRHDWYPYEPGFSKPNYTKEELEELNARNIEYNGKMYTEYEISQMQRYRERHIRELKRQTLKSQTAMDNSKDSVTKSKMQSEYQFAAYKLKRAEQKLQDFCKTTGRDRERAREQVNGFSRSEAQKAVHAAKKEVDRLKEKSIIISNKVISHSTIGEFTAYKNPKRPEKGGGNFAKGGHSQSNIEELERRGIKYNIEKIYKNGVRVGNVPTHKVREKTVGIGQAWFPKDWTDEDVKKAGQHVLVKKDVFIEKKDSKSGEIICYEIYSTYKGVTVGVITDKYGKLSDKNGTIFPDSLQRKLGDFNV